MNSSDWLSRKLGNQQPGGITVPAYRQPQPVFQQPQLPLYPQPQQQVPPPQPYGDTSTKMKEATLSDALRRTDLRGPAAKAEGHLSCPGCGSRTGYTEFSGGSGGSPGGHQATPHCFECGYNGKFVQAMQSSWG